MIRRRHRSAVLWAVVTFAAINLAVALATQGRPEWIDPPYGRRERRFHLRVESSPEPPVKLVFLGSSRTQMGINALSLDRPLAQAMNRPVVAFNFADTGAVGVKPLLRLRRLLDAGLRPDAVVIEILPMALCETYPPNAETGERVLASERLAFDELVFVERFALGTRPNLRTDWIRANALPLYARRFSLVSAVAPGLLLLPVRLDVGFDEGGSELQSAAQDAATRLRRLRGVEAEYKEPLRNLRMGPASAPALRELLELCRSQRIAALAVLMPEGPFMRNLYPGGQFEAVGSFARAFAEEHGASFHDARLFMKENDFLDSHHLHADGAGKFTDRLQREVLTEFLRRANR